VHLEKYPDLHALIWETTKLCSTVKQHVDLDAANQLMANIEKIHNIFWETKGRDVAWYVAS
jgi:nickel superoxide dismutase